MSRISEGNPAFVNRQSADEYTHPAKRVIDDTLEIKMRASVEMDNLLRASTFVRHVEDDGGTKEPQVDGVHIERYFRKWPDVRRRYTN